MRNPKRLLLLEDDCYDEELIRRRIKAEWPQCDVVCVQSEAEFKNALEEHPFDLIISDYVVPGFPGPSALAIARTICPGLPFLFVSGAIGDDVAVESLKAGATDYMLKDRLAKLAAAIRRALNEADDVAEKNRAIRQYEALVNSIDGIVWQADHSTLQLNFVSQQAERFLGYLLNEWLEPDFWQNHIHPDDREKAIQQRRLVTSEKPHHSFEYRMLAVDGRALWFRDIVSIGLEKDHPPQLRGITVDITARKHAEAARRDVQVKLERTNHVLSKRNQEIQSFYHTLSHELKTPLTSAREFISIVIDGLAGPLNARQMEYLGIAKDSCDQLRACVNDMLDATRLETSKLTLELKPTSVSKLVQRIATSMSQMAGEKQLVIKHEVQPELPEVHLDEHRITQILTNLVSNAVKYAPPGGTITLTAADAPGRSELIQFSVSDTGSGIPKEEQERIFDRLYQIKAGDAATNQGIGLGLYLCRELVQLHGGNIWVESEPGKGTTFSFVLPKTQQLLRSNILIIDDDPDLLEILRQLLSAEQYNVSTASDGREALREMSRQTPDVVLLDLAMPELSGAATLKEIRKKWGEVPVILHTAFAEGDLMKQALTSSPFTLLAKPCAPGQIIETVRQVQRSGDTQIWRKNHFGLQRLPMN